MVSAHMAVHTRQIKVGPAAVVMPFYEPLQLVEKICYAVQLTNGRLVLGLGTGYPPHHHHEFQKFYFKINDRLQWCLEVWDVIEQGLSTGVIDC